jgi:hypothetical protein
MRLKYTHEYCADNQRDPGDDMPRTRSGKIRLRSLEHLDARTAPARRARELVSELESDLGGGDRLPVAIRQLIQRAAMMAVMVEDIEVRWLERKPADLSTYGTLVDRQRRVLEALGLGRTARDVTPDATFQIVQAIRAGAA